MKAMVLRKLGPILETDTPLSLEELPDPKPGPGELLLRVDACGVCHTELDEIEGRAPPPRLPVVLGHQAVGRIVAHGPETDTTRLACGRRVGVAWIHSACGRCEHCRRGDDNLCAEFRATGLDANGGYAELMTVPERFAHPIPEVFTDAEAAPLLCAGAIGYRSLRLCNLPRGGLLGLTGFGASAHLVLTLARYIDPRCEVFVFARSPKEREFALELGAKWAGDTADKPPEKLHAIIDTTPVWRPIVEALDSLRPAGRLVINAIRKESHDQRELFRLDYPSHLWMEKEIKSVANVATRDVREFLEIAGTIPITPETQTFSLAEANNALRELKERKIRGAKVLVLNEETYNSAHGRNRSTAL